MPQKLFSILLLYCGILCFGQVEPFVDIKDALGRDRWDADCGNQFKAKHILNLSASYSKIGFTDIYKVAESKSAPRAFNSGMPLNMQPRDNNKFVKKIDIGFDFCFFDKKYSQVVIGTNGTVTFDDTLLGSINFPAFSESNPHRQLPVNSIFGIMQAMEFNASEGSDIYYETVGTAPRRQLIINYYNAKMFYNGINTACEDLRSSSQIVLHEGTNIIEVFIDKKPAFCPDSKFPTSLVGIIDSFGKLGYSPAGRNTGNWQAENEKWAFVPIGQRFFRGLEIQPTIEWFDSSGKRLDNTSKDVFFNSYQPYFIGIKNPKKNEVITVKLTHNICGFNYVVTDEFPINFSVDHPIPLDIYEVICRPTTVNLSDYISKLTPQQISYFNFRFYRTLAEAESGIGNGEQTVDISKKEIFYVRIENKSNPSCYDVAVLKLLLPSVAMACKAKEKNYKLSDFTSQILDEDYVGTVDYYLSDTGGVPVTHMDLTEGMNFWIKVKECDNRIGPVKVKLVDGPVVNPSFTFRKAICDNNYDGQEPYSVIRSEVEALITSESNIKIEYFLTYDLALSGYEGSSDMVLKEEFQKLFAKVINRTTKCFSIVEVNLDITFIKIKVASTIVNNICFDGTEDVTLDFKQAGLYTDSAVEGTVDSIRFYLESNDAMEGNDNNLQYYTITDDIKPSQNYILKKFFVRFDRGDCFVVREMEVYLVHSKPKSQITVCDLKNDGKEKIVLEDYIKKFIDRDPLLEVKMYSDSAYSQEITELEMTTASQTIYVEFIWKGKFINTSRCFSRYPVQLVLTPVPAINENPIVVFRDNECDNNANGYEIYDLSTLEHQIHPGDRTGIFFQYFKDADYIIEMRKEEYKNFKVGEEEKTVYVRVGNKFSDDMENCYSYTQIKIKYNFNNDPIKVNPAKIEQCSTGDLLTFELDKAMPQLFNQSQNTQNFADLTVKYYEKYDASKETVSNEISKIYGVGRSNARVYAEFRSIKNGCYSIAPIDLITYLPPFARTPVLEYCKHIGVNLSDYYGRTLLGSSFDPTAQYIYTFYLEDPKINPLAKEIDKNVIFNPQNGQRIWYKVEIVTVVQSSCADYGFIDFQLNENEVPLSQYEYTLPLSQSPCDEGSDGRERVTTLANYLENEISGTDHSYAYYYNYPTEKISNPNDFLFDENTHEKIWILVSKPGFCPRLISAAIQLRKPPVFVMDKAPYYFCPSKTISVLDVDLSAIGVEKYEWRDPSGKIISTDKTLLDIGIAGRYSLTATHSNACSYTVYFEIKEKDVPKIDQLIATKNSYTIIASGDPTKTILYSIDGEHWTTSNYFGNLKPDTYTFYLKYENEDCEGYPRKGLILDLDKNIITPNGDGYNDFWTLEGLEVLQGSSQLQIFDRSQQLIYEENSSSRISWDGKIKGRPLPTSTYWYILNLPDGRSFTGYIVVKNRD